MKHRNWVPHLISTAFAFALSVSAIGNLITGYRLPVDSLGTMILWCGIFSIASSLLFRFRYGGRIHLCIALLSLFLLWNNETLRLQIQHLSFLITSHYHAVYAWPILGKAAANDVSHPLLLWAALVAIGVNWHMCRQKSIFAAIIPVIMPLMLCLITNDRVPDTIYLHLMFLGLSILLLTEWTRRKTPTQGVKLILQMVIPIAAAITLLFVMNPREEYVNYAGKFQKEAVSWIQGFLDTTQSVASKVPTPTPDNRKVNLKTVGPKRLVSYSVMRVTSPVDGILYLRGRDYDCYSGTGWEASSDRKESFPSGTAPSGKLTIVTYGVRDILYIPYYANEQIHLQSGALENHENLQQYSYSLSYGNSGSSLVPSSRYTELPDATLDWATKLATKITDGAMSEQEKLLRIQNYIRNCAIYDLSTSRIDPQHTDFAKWFLEESETGYCVHFATAATVLLRAAGIPARYVEGYMINCSAGTDAVVSNQEAHAWTEYYDTDLGAWRILDATPADPSDAETEPAVTVPETEAAPDESRNPEPTSADDDPAIPQYDQNQTPDFSENFNSHPSQAQQFHIPRWFTNLLKCLIFASFLPIQAYLRIYWKQSVWNRGNVNERAINRWLQTQKAAKVLRLPYPEKLDALAQKAAFSPHRIQAEELEQFDEYRHFFTSLIRGKPWCLRILYLWIFAIG